MDNESLRDRLAKHWGERDPATFATHAAARLLNDAGDWDPPSGITPSRELIRMSIGVPDETTLPRAALRAAADRVFAQSDEAPWVYGFGQGYPPLREILAERYTSRRGAGDADWFQITNGSSGAIDLICRALVNPGDVIIVESPAYMGSLRNFRGIQADIRAVPVDAEGLSTDDLAVLLDALDREGKTVKFIYTISTFQNPTGATLSEARRHALLDLADRYNALVLDDDAYGDLHFGEHGHDPRPPALSALAGGRGVITVGSLSKVVAPGLRIGWIHAAPEWIALFGHMRFGMGQNQMMLRAVADYLGNGVLDQHIEAVRGLYARKMDKAAKALEASAGQYLTFARPAGGFYLWATLADGLSSKAVWEAAYAEGVSINRGVNFHPDRRETGRENLRIAYAWTPEDLIDEGAARIGAACARVARGAHTAAKGQTGECL